MPLLRSSKLPGGCCRQPHRLLQAFGGLLLCLTLAACHLIDSAPDQPLTALPSAVPTALTPIPTIVMSTSAPTETPVPAASETTDGWQEVGTGLAWRSDSAGGNFTAQIVGLRIDPALYTFRVHYRPGDPLTLAGWREVLPDAVAMVNASFFNPGHEALGLIIADGVAYGSSLQNLGGTFAVQKGQPLLRSNIYEPYQGESYEQAVQGFPMLVYQGVAAFTDTLHDETTRRTVAGIDRNGQIVLLATPLFGLRLTDLSTFLAGDPYRLTAAVNLDGGGSTMMWFRPAEFSLTSFDAVPAVLAVYERR